MASLINNKETLLEFVRINFINETSSFPDFNLAADRFLIPLIGRELYEELLGQVLEFDIPGEGEDPVEIEEEELVRKCRAVIAPLGYLMELPVIQAGITDSGIKTTNTENQQAAHRWEYNEIKDHLLDKGIFAAEELLTYLFENKETYEDWTDSDEYKDLSSLIFTSGKDFSKYFPIKQPHLLYWDLRPLIKEVEDHFIASAIGEDFYKELKEESNPGEEEKKVIVLIKKAVAQFTIVNAVEKKTVQFGPNGFTTKVLGAYSEGTGYDQQAAPDQQLSVLYTSCEKSGNSYLRQAVEYLNQKASADLFSTYKDSQYYTDPSSAGDESKNSNRKIFGL